MMILLLAIVVIVFMTSPHFAHSGNKFKVSSTEIRQELSAKILDSVISDQAVRTKVMDEIHRIPETFTEKEWEQPLSQQKIPIRLISTRCATRSATRLKRATSSRNTVRFTSR